MQERERVLQGQWITRNTIYSINGNKNMMLPETMHIEMMISYKSITYTVRYKSMNHKIVFSNNLVTFLVTN